MSQHKLRRPLAGLTAGLLAGAVLTISAPAAEAAAFTTSEWNNYQSGGVDTGNCATNFSDTSPTDTPIVANGVAAVQTNSMTFTNTNNGDATDTATTVVNHQATAKVTPNGNDPGQITLQYSGTSTTTTTKAVSECAPRGYTGIEVDFTFTLTRPMWVDMTMMRRGSTDSEVYIYDDVEDPYQDWYGRDLDVDGSQRVYLPAGVYGGYLNSEISVPEVKTAKSVTGSGNLTMKFTPAGARDGAAEGKGRRYVAFPLMRDCANGNVLATVTTKKVRAKAIERIIVRTNGVKKTFKKTPRGKVLTLPAAANKAANIKATVVLKNGDKKKVTVSYLACSN
jgi:hypothetical protein